MKYKDVAIKGNGRIICNRDKESNVGKTELFIQVNSLTVWRLDLGDSNGKMEVRMNLNVLSNSKLDMKDNLKMVN